MLKRGGRKKTSGKCICKLGWLKPEKGTLVIQVADREYTIAGLAGHRCDGLCGKWFPRKDQQIRAEQLAWSAHIRPFLLEHTRCERCGDLSQHAHHRKHRSQGGGDGYENLEALCWDCHERHHGRPQLQWRPVA